MLVRTLIVVYDISEVVSAAVVCLAHAHGVVREVDVAIVACDVAVSRLLWRKSGAEEGGPYRKLKV